MDSFMIKKSDYNILKKTFLEKFLIYINQGTISNIRGDLAIYTDCFILGQLIPAQNSPKDIHANQNNHNEVKMVILLYNLETGDFLGLTTTLAYLVLEGDVEKSKVFFYSAKDKIPNASTATTFKNITK